MLKVLKVNKEHLVQVEVLVRVVQVEVLVLQVQVVRVEHLV